MANHDVLIHGPGPDDAQVSIAQPQSGDTFAPGEVVNMQFEFTNFELAPLEGHNGGDHNSDANDLVEVIDSIPLPVPIGDHDLINDHHGGVTSGHYHIYLDTQDDNADHITAWSETLGFQLPTDIEPGSHELRISLRAPDHHATGAVGRVTIKVE